MFLATLDGRERHDMFGTLGERNLDFGARSRACARLTSG